MIFDFIKKAGTRLIENSGADMIKDLLVGDANAAEKIEKNISQYDLGIDGLKADIDGDKVILTGTAKTAA